MSELSNEAIIKELIRELINKYIENAYPWGLLTKPLTPIAMSVLALIYALTISMLTIGTIQVLALVIYGVRSIKYLKQIRNRAYGSTIPKRSLPRVTVLIPVKNESMDTIIMQLRNLANLEYPRELLEVLFISDDTKEYAEALAGIVRRYSMNVGLNAKLIHRPYHVGYKGGALNYGLRYAGGDVVLIMDVDTVLSRDYLIKAIGLLLDGYDAVTATWKGYSMVDTVFSRISNFMYNVYNEFFIRGRFLSGGFPAISGNNLVIWKHVLNKIGGFCECTGEDLDLSIRLRYLGYRVGLINEDVHCEVPHDYQSFKLQFSRWLFNGIWNLKHNINLVLRSKYMSKWEKIDAILWMLQFPSTSFAALSVIVSMIMGIMGVLIPPLSLSILEVTFILSIMALFIVIIMIGKNTGYKLRDTLTYNARVALVILLLSFPMLINTVESLISDEYQWVVTPKGPVNRLGISLRYMFSELIAMLLILAITILSIVYKQFILFIYSVTVLVLMIYGIRLIILSHRGIRYRR